MFGNKSGIAMMLESILPPDLMGQIMQAAKTIPGIVEGIKQTMDSVDTRLRLIADNQAIIIGKLERIEQRLDPSVAAPETALSLLDGRVQEGTISEEDENLMREIPVTGKPN